MEKKTKPQLLDEWATSTTLRPSIPEWVKQPDPVALYNACAPPRTDGGVRTRFRWQPPVSFPGPDVRPQYDNFFELYGDIP